VHLGQDIRRFGPAIHFSTEVFECFNAIFRLCSIYSNHQAASHDSAHKFASLDRLKHILSGGTGSVERGSGLEQVQVFSGSWKKSPLFNAILDGFHTQSQFLVSLQVYKTTQHSPPFLQVMCVLWESKKTRPANGEQH